MLNIHLRLLNSWTIQSYTRGPVTCMTSIRRLLVKVGPVLQFLPGPRLAEQIRGARLTIGFSCLRFTLILMRLMICIELYMWVRVNMGNFVWRVARTPSSLCSSFEDPLTWTDVCARASAHVSTLDIDLMILSDRLTCLFFRWGTRTLTRRIIGFTTSMISKQSRQILEGASSRFLFPVLILDNTYPGFLCLSTLSQSQLSRFVWETRCHKRYTTTRARDSFF